MEILKNDVDVNQDETVNLKDFTFLVNFIKSFDSDGDNLVDLNDVANWFNRLDLNKDGKINIDDAKIILEYLYS